MADYFRAEKATTLAMVIAPVLASGLFLGGCMSSPTYGTDKTAGEQLLTDVTSMTSLSAKKQGPPIAYTPRPDLVKPATTKDLSLPAPQDQVASVENPDWPESPEQRRKRIRAENDERNDAGAFRGAVGTTPNPEIAVEPATASIYDDDKKPGQSPRYRPGTDQTDNAARSAEIKRRIRENNQGSATTRRYLSEPPLVYREPAATAPADDVGEDEAKKERAAKAAARKPNSSRWKEWIPGL